VEARGGGVCAFALPVSARRPPWSGEKEGLGAHGLGPGGSDKLMVKRGVPSSVLCVRALNCFPEKKTRSSEFQLQTSKFFRREQLYGCVW
jgi:hypothetical protein